MKTKGTKRALLMSVLALVLCMAMLIGTTFAWFTDSVSTGVNTIQSGTLELDIVSVKTGASLDKQTMSFADVNGNTDILWEPGATFYLEDFQLVNKGNLALKYQILLNGLEGDIKLLEAVDLYIQVGDAEPVLLKDWDSAAKEAHLSPNDSSDVIKIYGHMQEEAGNEYQGLTIEGISLTIVATQYTEEVDYEDDQYDVDAPLDFTPVSNEDELRRAINNKEPNITLTDNIIVTDEPYELDYDANINGGGKTIYRTSGAALMTLDAEAPTVYTGVVFNVKAGATLTLENVIVDGGAVWTGEVNEVLQRGTVNAGVTASGALVNTEANATVILNKGAVLQNNEGANAVNLGTRIGAKLIIDGGEIINNSSAAGAIWGGGEIVLNSGKVNGNYGGIGGAIRVVTNVGTVLTMNGGEMNHNLSGDVGGAIWAGTSRSSNVYVLNGGEMAYNYSPVAGGAIYAGYYETVKIGGTFKMHDNAAPSYGAIRFHDHASFEMTDGEIYNNGMNSLFLYNNSASITGGKITDSFGYSGGLGLTWGEAEVDGVITYNLSTNHNTAYLAKEFGTLKFTVNEADEHFGNFNFKPANDYAYAEGDEAKLICMNEGYETYWDAATGTFRLQAK